MTPVEKRPNDTKLIFAIAGFVVLGTAGIALLAGWSSIQDEPSTTARAAQTRPAPKPAMPARHAREIPAPIVPVTTPAVDPTFSVEPIEPVTEPDAEPTFVPQPDENFVARGIETYEARDYTKAVAYWQAEVDARPQRAWSQYMLALSLWKDGRTDEAVGADGGVDRRRRDLDQELRQPGANPQRPR